MINKLHGHEHGHGVHAQIVDDMHGHKHGHGVHAWT